MKTKLMLLTAALGLAAVTGRATTYISDDFDRADGNLAGTDPSIGGTWTNHSGTGSFVQIDNNAIVLQHGSGSREDINSIFDGGTLTSGTIYAGFDFSVTGSNGSADEYFAHFKDDASDFTGRVHIDPANATGDFTIGISGSASSPDSTWATDLTHGTTYRAVIGFDFGTGISTLWIDASLESDTNIVSAADTVADLESFAFRQSSSSETIMIDNLVVADNFSAAAIPEPSTFVLVGLTGLAGFAAYRRRNRN